MTNTSSRPLDVLVVESHPGVGQAASEALTAAGHTVHRCHEAGTPAFPCKGLTDAEECPVGPNLDVALLVRRRVTPRPTELEGGASCVIRAGVPLVEYGPDVLDPFERWIAGRAENDDDVVSSVESAAAEALRAVARAVEQHLTKLLQNEGIDPGAIHCSIERRHPRLVVRLRSDVVVDERVRHAIGVRALDAIRANMPVTYGEVTIKVDQPEAPAST